jgi:hypothetical protein
MYKYVKVLLQLMATVKHAIKRKNYYDKNKQKIITIGESYNNRIFDFIAKHKEGVFPYQITESVNISPKPTRQTIHAHLRALLLERRIYQKNRRYYAEDSDLNSINLFARVMKDGGMSLIDPYLIYPPKDFIDLTNSKSTPYHELLKRVYGISLSRKFWNSTFTKHNLHEKYLFEFADRIGAFILYIFIECMRPIDHITLAHEKKNVLASDLIHRAINLEEMFDSFCSFLNESGLITCDETRNHKRLPFSLDKIHFDKISEIFRKIYPGIYEGLEKYWLSSRQSWIKIDTNLAINEKCNHKWEETYIHKYKLGKYYLCRKCHLITDSPTVSTRKK